MKVILFLGAGVSRPSGMPLVQDLNESIFHDPYHQAGFNIFKAGRRPKSIRDLDNTARIRRFLHLLKGHDTRDMKRVGYSPSDKRSWGAVFRGDTNYEDLFFLCEQIKYWNIGLVDNSMVTPLMEVIEDRAGSLLKGRSRMTRLSEIGSLGEMACFFIESVVADTLRPRPPVGFDLIYELASSPNIERLDIMTLNHDTLVEQFLTQKRVDFADGFGEQDGDVRWYDDEAYEMSRAKVRVFKLHGSINWYSFLAGGRAKPAILLGPDIENIRDGQGNQLKPLFRRPSFLTGINKAVSYKRGIYADLHFHFEQVLRQSKFLVMSGYGWGDAAMNVRLEAWLDQSRRNAIVLLHPDPKKIEDASLTVASNYDAWIKLKQLVPITKWLCETSINDLKNLLVVGS